MYTLGRFTLLYGKNKYNIVKQLFFNEKLKKKRHPRKGETSLPSLKKKY